VPDSSRRKAAFLVVAAAAGKCFCIGVGDLGRFELVQNDGAKQGLDVLLNNARVTLVALGRNLRLDMAEPPIEELVESLLARLDIGAALDGRDQP
jgi:hypothetical protein